MGLSRVCSAYLGSAYLMFKAGKMSMLSIFCRSMVSIVIFTIQNILRKSKMVGFLENCNNKNDSENSYFSESTPDKTPVT